MNYFPKMTGTAIEVSRSGEAMVMIETGGRRAPMYVSPRCKTCHSPYRRQIENALAKTYGYAAIVRSLPEDADLNERNIMHHAKRHMGMDDIARRILIEEDAKERGMDIEGYEGMLGNHVTFAKLGLQKVLQRMMDGELEPDLDHGIAFANFLQKVESVAGDGVDMEAISQGFVIYIEAMRSVCTDEQMQAIADRINTNPVMRALLAQQQAGSVIDAESDEYLPELD